MNRVFQFLPVTKIQLAISSSILAGLQMMLVSYSIKVSRIFNQSARIIFPTTLHSRLVHLGNSSFTVEDVLKDAEKDDVLIAVRGTFVIMNQKTRRSEPFKAQTRCIIFNIFAHDNFVLDPSEFD